MDRQHVVQLHRRIPFALMLTVFLQAASVIWWASTTQAQDVFRDRRLGDLEQSRLRDNDKLEHVLERLARLESQSEAQLRILQHLDAPNNRRR
jgi:hypothetical protein